MTGWQLKSGSYVSGETSERDFNEAIEAIYRYQTTTYKCGLVAALVYSFPLRGKNRLNFDTIFYPFTALHWDMVKLFGLKTTTQKNLSAIEKVLLHYEEKTPFTGIGPEIVEAIIKSIKKAAKKYVFGATFSSSNKLLFSFDVDSEVLEYSPAFVSYLKSNCSDLLKQNNRILLAFLRQHNSDCVVDKFESHLHSLFLKLPYFPLEDQEMAFTSLNIEKEYRSDERNIVKDFYLPCLDRTKLYCRAVGYFTSNSLALAAKGVAALIQNGGKMQLVASPYFSKEDIEALTSGVQKKSIVEGALFRELENIEDNIINKRLEFLAWMVANDLLEIRIAVVKANNRGIFHEKVGLFFDNADNIICFSGSANETTGGLYSNFESIDVFCSWVGEDLHRIEKKRQNFVKLWENETDNLEIMSLPEAIESKILQHRNDDMKLEDPENMEVSPHEMGRPKEVQSLSSPGLPPWLVLRDYQKEAINSWFQNEAKGVWEMATGTGKTITALAATVTLMKNLEHLAVVIVCPYQHLVSQWQKEARLFGLDPHLAFKSSSSWLPSVNEAITNLNLGVLSNVCIITTNSSFIKGPLQSCLRKIRKPALLVADEVHNLGAPNARSKLPESFIFRLGLSATPERWFDKSGTEELLKYFGNGVIYRFGLEKAIGTHLTPYYYYPYFVELTEEETEDYYSLSKKIAKVFPKDEDYEMSDGLKLLLIKRARIISGAENKLPLLAEIMKDKVDSTHNIFYCGDTKVLDDRYLNSLVKLLGKQLGMRVHKFTAQEDSITRASLLNEFKSGNLQGLVAIRCLDEGVDVPATKNAFFLASSTNPRQFIQRRGRILRKHESKQFSSIYDFIVMPQGVVEIKQMGSLVFNVERKILARELARFEEFASLALNYAEVQDRVLEIKKSFNLLDV